MSAENRLLSLAAAVAITGCAGGPPAAYSPDVSYTPGKPTLKLHPEPSGYNYPLVVYSRDNLPFFKCDEPGRVVEDGEGEWAGGTCSSVCVKKRDIKDAFAVWVSDEEACIGFGPNLLLLPGR